MRKILISLICLAVISSALTRAQEPAEPDARLRALEERIRSLESTVASLQAVLAASGQPTVPSPVVGASAEPAVTQILPQASTEPAPVLGGAGGMAKALNPDIGVIGNFIGAAGRNDIAGVPSLSLAESEFGFQAIVDPYARADFFVSIGPEGAEVEEGYITFTSLPGGFLGKVGRMRSNFGKLNPQHNHVLPWVDRPLISANLLGGEEGIVDEGLHISRILPAPPGVFLEGSAEVYRGSSGDLFLASRRSDVSSIFRLRGYGDLSESTNLEVASSFARGRNDANWDWGGVCTSPSPLATPDLYFCPPLIGKRDFYTHLYGIDSTLRWKPLRRAIYHSFIARAEAVWSQREQFEGEQSAFGYYASADYQLARRWFAGARIDWAERARDDSAHDSSQSVVLTYWPSEFSQIRGQLRRTRYAEASTANEFLFQFQFNIGAHGAHPF